MRRPVALALGAALAAHAGAASAVDGLEIGPRLDVRLGTGKPTNDILGGGLVASYPLGARGWRAGAALDHVPTFDIEYPLTFLGLEGPDEDSEGSSTMVTAFVERRYREGTAWEPFWTLGLGLNTIDVDPFTGTLDDGSAFDVRIDAGTESVIDATLGVRYRFGGAWSAFASAILQHRFADWTVEELESESSTSVGDYTVHGAHFGLGYRF